MCIGLRIRCNDCKQLTSQVITTACKAGSRHHVGRDLRDTRNPQCNGSGCDYTERTIQNCDRCYRKWREGKIEQLRLTQLVLEDFQHEGERPYWPSEEDETSPDPRKARRARAHRLLRADVAIALRIVRRQVNRLRREKDDDEGETRISIQEMNMLLDTEFGIEENHNGQVTGVSQEILGFEIEIPSSQEQLFSL